MGKDWHNIKPRVAGFVEYHLSPFEQRAFGGLLKEGIGNSAYRWSKNIFAFVPFYLYYKWAQYCFWTVEQGHRKKNLPEYEAYFASLKEQEQEQEQEKK